MFGQSFPICHYILFDGVSLSVFLVLNNFLTTTTKVNREYKLRPPSVFSWTFDTHFGLHSIRLRVHDRKRQLPCHYEDNRKTEGFEKSTKSSTRVLHLRFDLETRIPKTFYLHQRSKDQGPFSCLTTFTKIQRFSVRPY